MEDFELDDDGIVTDEEVEIPPVEVRVPSAWTAKMSAKALRQAAPMELPLLLTEVCGALEDRTNAMPESVAGTDLPTFVWDRLLTRHAGNHKAVEQSLSAIINGVEASWNAHAAVQAFGELCGMLSADHNEVVSRRVLTLLSPAAAPPLLPSDGIASCLAAADGDDDGEVPLTAAQDALPRLRLEASAQSALSEELSKLADASHDGASVRLDKLMLSATLAVRQHASGAPADIVEEEEGLRAAMAASTAERASAGASPAVEEEGVAEAAEEAAEEEGAEDDDNFEEDVEDEDEPISSSAPAPSRGVGGGSSSAALWSVMASVLKVGSDVVAAAQREALFDQLDSDADGQLSIEELESALPAAVLSEVGKAKQPPRGGVPSSPPPLLRAAVGRAFEAAKSLSITAQVRDTTLSRDGFDRVCAYLHVTCTMLGQLEMPPTASEVDGFDTAAHDVLVASLPSSWQLDAEEAKAAFVLLAEEQPGPDGRVNGDDCLHALAMRAVQHLCAEAEEPGGAPHSRAPPGGGDDDAEVAGDEDGFGLDAPREVLPPPAPHGLGTVFETTERSAFSTTGEWGRSAESGAMGNATLGGDANMSSVKVGFFDASKLGDLSDDDDDDTGSGGSLRTKYDRARAELAQLKQQQHEERANHKETVRKMLQANEALQMQLRDLNSLVERVVQKSLGHPASEGSTPRLPAGAFPAQAKPGSKQQRASAPSSSAGPPPRAPKQQPTRR